VREERIRSIIREEVQKKFALDAFGEEFEFILTEAALNELDASSMLGQAGDFLGDTFSLSNIGTGAVDALKQAFTAMVLRHLGITSQSIFGLVIINVIQNLRWTDLGSYLDDDGCNVLTDDIIRGVQQGLVQEPTMNMILASFFGPGAQAAGILGGPIREIINAKLESMTVALREPIRQFVCDHRDFDKLIGDYKSMPTVEKGMSAFDKVEKSLPKAKEAPKMRSAEEIMAIGDEILKRKNYE
jgi:hypothetical protein